MYLVQPEVASSSSKVTTPGHVSECGCVVVRVCAYMWQCLYECKCIVVCVYFWVGLGVVLKSVRHSYSLYDTAHQKHISPQDRSYPEQFSELSEESAARRKTLYPEHASLQIVRLSGAYSE